MPTIDSSTPQAQQYIQKAQDKAGASAAGAAPAIQLFQQQFISTLEKSDKDAATGVPTASHTKATTLPKPTSLFSSFTPANEDEKVVFEALTTVTTAEEATNFLQQANQAGITPKIAKGITSLAQSSIPVTIPRLATVCATMPDAPQFTQNSSEGFTNVNMAALLMVLQKIISVSQKSMMATALTGAKAVNASADATIAGGQAQANATMKAADAEKAQGIAGMTVGALGIVAGAFSLAGAGLSLFSTMSEVGDATSAVDDEAGQLGSADQNGGGGATKDEDTVAEKEQTATSDQTSQESTEVDTTDSNIEQGETKATSIVGRARESLKKFFSKEQADKNKEIELKEFNEKNPFPPPQDEVAATGAQDTGGAQADDQNAGGAQADASNSQGTSSATSKGPLSKLKQMAADKEAKLSPKAKRQKAWGETCTALGNVINAPSAMINAQGQLEAAAYTTQQATYQTDAAIDNAQAEVMHAVADKTREFGDATFKTIQDMIQAMGSFIHEWMTAVRG